MEKTGRGRPFSRKENTLHRAQKGFALRATGPVGDVIGRERIAQLIEFRKTLGFVMGGANEG